MRQQIVDYITEHLAEIQQANGYQTDIGNHVESWVIEDIVAAKLPIVCVYDQGSVADEEFGQHEHHLDIEIDAVVIGRSAQIDARKYISDLYMWLGNHTDMGGVCHDLSYKGDEISVERGGHVIAIAGIRFRVSYLTHKYSNTLEG